MNNLGQDIWLLERRGVHRKLASQAVPQGLAGVAGDLGSSEDLSAWVWGTCIRKQSGRLGGPSSWKLAGGVLKRKTGLYL